MTIPTVADFKAYFNRDFPYGTDLATTILDADIVKALQDAGVNFNQSLFLVQSDFSAGYLNLAAHFLVMNLRASSQGIAGQYSWLQSSKGVGSVSEGFSIPERIMVNPEFAMLCKTTYGAKFLFMVLPYLSGNIFSTPDVTLA